MITAFPKIFAIGTDYIKDIFNEEVEITEKVDGSQWVFGKVWGTLYMRSKGCIQYAEKHDKMFSKAVEYVTQLTLPDNVIFYCEYLQSPKHNTLKYEKVPKNNLVLFGVMSYSQKFVSKHEELKQYADMLNIDVIPLIYKGKINNPEELIKMLETESYLGGNKVEGIVVKNYDRPFLLGGQPIPVMAGKYVSEAFKEVHRKSWGKEHTGKGKWDTFKEGYKTEARWNKAIQHYKEKGLYTGSPKDIGPLLKEIQEDIKAEEKQVIMEFLWREFSPELLRAAVSGFPEHFKMKLMEETFEGEKDGRESI
jgi:hypothetical protein